MEDHSHILELCTRYPQRPTGRVFLVDKNSRNAEEARLVVDFSQFSKGNSALSFSKYWAPNLAALSRILPMAVSRISLDVSQAFYYIPMYPLSTLWLAVSDRQHVYYFRKAPVGVSLSPFLLHLLSTILAAKIAKRFNIWAFIYMVDFLLCHPRHHYLVTASNFMCHFLQSVDTRINYDKATPEPVRDIRLLGYKINDILVWIPDEQWTKTRDLIKKISSVKE